MHISTKKWLFLKCSSLILIPLMIWFIINLVSIYQADYKEVINFFTQQPSKILFSLFAVFAYFFSALTISEIFEDYINDEKIKNVANKLLNIFAIVTKFVPLAFLLSLIISISKFERQQELLILWTTGLNKIKITTN